MERLDPVIVVHVGALEIPVEVTRKRVKNLNLRVRSDGSVSLSVPYRTSAHAARHFLERKAPWIARHVAENLERSQGLGSRGGALSRVPLWGEMLPLDEFAIRMGLAPEKRAILDRQGLDALYRTEIQRALPGVVEPLEALIGVHAARWSVRPMKTRWGSCTPQTASIRINARLAAYPPACLEFVVAHELVHLLEPSHNARFHTLLDTACPRNRELAAILKRPAGAVRDGVTATQPRPCGARDGVTATQP